MESYLIYGGKPLEGTVQISGAKNSALGLLAATIMTDDTCELSNLPNVSDVNNMLDVIETINGRVTRLDPHKVKISGKQVNPDYYIDYDSVKKMRASYYLLGALLGKYGKAKVALPGGCEIGNRPIDQHFKGFKLLGATISLENGIIIAEAKQLKGCSIYLDVPSVGATINIMLAAVYAKGRTYITNCAKEPHVVDVANLLNFMGAKIRGAGTDMIEIQGVKKLHGASYAVIPDQIEAGTFMLATCITGGDVVLENIIPKHLEIIAHKIKELGVSVTFTENSVHIKGRAKYPITVVTSPYPGFPTDLQPQISVVCGCTKGTSLIKETIFEKRYCYVDEVARMGAKMKVTSDSLIIQGVSQYQNAIVEAPDLRAGAALVLAGLNAPSFSVVQNIKYIKRGYEDFDKKLKQLGADIQIIEENSEMDINRIVFKESLKRNIL